MSQTLPHHSAAIARVQALRAMDKLCCDRLDNLNRAAQRISPCDKLFDAIVQETARWTREHASTKDALWDALSDMNRTATPRDHGPRLIVVK
ncbi:MAG: hypothetical protein ACWA5A_13435 [Marinibacterium sp.]